MKVERAHTSPQTSAPPSVLPPRPTFAVAPGKGCGAVQAPALTYPNSRPPTGEARPPSRSTDLPADNIPREPPEMHSPEGASAGTHGKTAASPSRTARGEFVASAAPRAGTPDPAGGSSDGRFSGTPQAPLRHWHPDGTVRIDTSRRPSLTTGPRLTALHTVDIHRRADHRRSGRFCRSRAVYDSQRRAWDSNPRDGW